MTGEGEDEDEMPELPEVSNLHVLYLCFIRFNQHLALFTFKAVLQDDFDFFSGDGKLPRGEYHQQEGGDGGGEIGEG